jgi:hypothetical protein
MRFQRKDAETERRSCGVLLCVAAPLRPRIVVSKRAMTGNQIAKPIVDAAIGIYRVVIGLPEDTDWKGMRPRRRSGTEGES